MPNLRLSSQLQGIAVPLLVTNYTARRAISTRLLPESGTAGASDLTSHQSNAPTIIPPTRSHKSHSKAWYVCTVTVQWRSDMAQVSDLDLDSWSHVNFSHLNSHWIVDMVGRWQRQPNTVPQHHDGQWRQLQFVITKRRYTKSTINTLKRQTD